MNIPVGRGAGGFDRVAISTTMMQRMVQNGIFEHHEHIELIEGRLVVLAPLHLECARLAKRLAFAL